MIPAHAGSSSYYSQYMTGKGGGGAGGFRGSSSSSLVMKERLLTDRDAYLAHLEEQLHRVTQAVMLADELKVQQTELQNQVLLMYIYWYYNAPGLPIYLPPYLTLIIPHRSLAYKTAWMKALNYLRRVKGYEQRKGRWQVE